MLSHMTCKLIYLVTNVTIVNGTFDSISEISFKTDFNHHVITGVGKRNVKTYISLISLKDIQLVYTWLFVMHFSNFRHGPDFHWRMLGE